MSADHMNIMRREAQMQAGTRANTRAGIVTAYDKDHYAAKVRIQPEDLETGWLPVQSPWVGNGWGMYAPPSPGDVVDVNFQEDDKESPFISMRFFSNKTRPLPVTSGEFWLVHQSGSFLKFLNNGDIEINAVGKVIGVAQEWDLTGDVKVTGNITASEEIYDRNGADGNIGHIRTTYDTHTHPAPDGDTGIPHQQLDE